MGRIRTVKPEFFTSEELSSLPESTHLLAAGLLCYADDDGYFNANPGLIKANIFPLREPSVSVPEMLLQLARVDYILLGEGSDGKRYGKVTTFGIHQRVSHPTPSKIRGMAIEWDYSLNTHRGLIDDSVNPPEFLRPEGNREVGREGKGSDEGITPDMVARGVLEDLRLAGRDLVLNLESIARVEMRGGLSADKVRQAMVAAWQLYEKAKPSLEFAKGPAKFFGDGDWRNPKSWPKKKNTSGDTSAMKFAN